MSSASFSPSSFFPSHPCIIICTSFHSASNTFHTRMYVWLLKSVALSFCIKAYLPTNTTSHFTSCSVPDRKIHMNTNVTEILTTLNLLEGQPSKLQAFQKLSVMQDVARCSFLTQVTEKLTRGCALLDLILTNKGELVRNMKLRGSLGCRHREMEEFRILRETTRHTVLDLCTPTDIKRALENWQIFKNHFLQTQELSIPMNRNSSKSGKKACVDQWGAPERICRQKISIWNVVTRTDDPGRI